MAIAALHPSCGSAQSKRNPAFPPGFSLTQFSLSPFNADGRDRRPHEHPSLRRHHRVAQPYEVPRRPWRGVLHREVRRPFDRVTASALRRRDRQSQQLRLERHAASGEPLRWADRHERVPGTALRPCDRGESAPRLRCLARKITALFFREIAQMAGECRRIRRGEFRRDLRAPFVLVACVPGRRVARRAHGRTAPRHLLPAPLNDQFEVDRRSGHATANS
jgi:hypothetical protein